MYISIIIGEKVIFLLIPSALAVGKLAGQQIACLELDVNGAHKRLV